MPGLAGAKFAGELAERYPALPVIWMSGYPREATFAGEEPGDAGWFLQKPIHPDHLAATVARALNRAGSGRVPRHAERGAGAGGPALD